MKLKSPSAKIKRLTAGLLTLALVAAAWPVYGANIGVSNFIDSDSGDLTQRREQAKQQCEAQFGGLGAGIPGSLRTTLENGLRQQLPQATANLIPQSLPTALNQQLNREVDQSIRRHLPLALGQLIRGSGYSDAELPLRLPELINQAMRDIAPAVTADVRQRRRIVILNAVRDLLGQNLPAELQQIVPALLAGDFEQRLGEMVNQVAGRPGINQGDRDAIGGNLLNLITQNITGGLTPDSARGLTNQLGFNLQNPLDGVLGGHLNYFTGNLLTPLNNAAGQIGNALLAPVNASLLGLTNVITQPLNTLVSGITQAVTAPLTQLTTAVTSAITAPLNQLTSAITAPLNNFASSISGQIGSIFNPAINSAVGGLAGEAVSGVTGQAAGLAQQSLAGTGLEGTALGQEVGGGLAGGVQSSAAGTAPPPAGGEGGAAALAVPVQEIYGPLLFLTQNIDTTTKSIDATTQQIKSLTEEIKKLQIQACTHLKVIRDMQLALEEKEFVYDREARKAAYTAHGDFFQFWRENVIRQGRAVSPGTVGVEGTQASGQPTINVDPEQNRRDAAAEATGRVIHRIKEGGNLYKEQLAAAVEAQQNTTWEQELTSTLTEEGRNKLLNPKDLSDDEFKTLALQAVEPPNNRPVATMLALNFQAQEAARAVADANAEYLASGGYHSIRKCIGDLVFNGRFCDQWRIVAPASFVRFVTEYLAGNALGLLFNAHELGEDFPKTNLDEQAAAITNLAEEPAAAPTTSQQDPCPGPDPCPETGWRPGGVNFDFSQSAINQIISSGSGSGGGGGGGGGGGNDGFDVPPPEIVRFEAVQQEPDSWLVEWQTQNTVACRALNAWQNTEPPIGERQIVELNGQTAVRGQPASSFVLQCINLLLQATQRELNI